MQTTTGNRRDSLLELFDPLVNTRPQTPPRSSSTGSESPDSSVGSSSDKENDNPTPSRCGPVTEYFMRIYKDPKHTQLTEPQSASGRLIDLSMTVEDEDSENRASGEDGERMEGVEDFGGCLGPDDSAAEYLQEMRMPLAELQLDKLSLPAEQPEAAMEIDPGSTHHDDNATQPRSSQPDHSQPLRSVITAPAPLGTPLADIINSINYGTSPSISICPPDDDIVFEPEYESPLPRNSHPSTSEDSHLSPDSSLTSFRAAGTLRRTITSSANDPRRISCDLQSSFSLVMQSSEMSFDLLNDKISFFGQGQQQESSWPGEHEDDILDFSNNDKVAPMGDEGMMKAEDVSMEDDTFDFAKEKKMMDALGEKYGSIHEERLRPVERAAEAAVANSPKQRGISEVPLPRFTLSPRPSPLKEELIAAKNESELEEELVEPMHIPNIFAQSLSESAGNENQEPIDSEPSRVVKPRRSSIATPGALSRRLSIPALAIFKKAEEPKHKRTVSSASTASSIDTTSRASLARRGSLSSSKASADNTRSTSTATTSLARRGSLSAMKAASLGRLSGMASAKPERERTTSSATTANSVDSTSRSTLSRRGSVSGSKAGVDNARSTSSVTASLSRRGSAPAPKASSGGRPSVPTVLKAVQPVKSVQRPPLGTATPSASARSLPPRVLGHKPTPSITRVASASVAQRPVTSKSTLGRSVSTALQRSTAAPAISALKASTSRAPIRPSASNSNSTSTGPPTRPPLSRMPSKLPGITRSLSIGTKSSTLPRKA